MLPRKFFPGAQLGELLDRDFQRKLLFDLKDIYPRSASVAKYWVDEPINRLVVNLSYLAEHGLIAVTRSTPLSGEVRIIATTITAAGMDFIADDGGLSAILGVVTVKLHDDTIRQLLIDRIEKAEGDRSVKDSLIAKIKDLPAEALGAATMAGLDAALQQAPNVIALLRGVFHI